MVRAGGREAGEVAAPYRWRSTVEGVGRRFAVERSGSLARKYWHTPRQLARPIGYWAVGAAATAFPVDVASNAALNASVACCQSPLWA